jgi:hypothetical protein
VAGSDAISNPLERENPDFEERRSFFSPLLKTPRKIMYYSTINSVDALCEPGDCIRFDSRVWQIWSKKEMGDEVVFLCNSCEKTKSHLSELEISIDRSLGAIVTVTLQMPTPTTN